MQKAPYVFPVIGGRKIEHLRQNIQALDIALSEDHIKEIEAILPFDVGFPMNQFVSCPILFREIAWFDELCWLGGRLRL